MDFVSGENQKKCLNKTSNTFCNKNHYIKNLDGEFFVVNVDDFFEICRHHWALVQAWCDIVCPSDIKCSMHFKLKRLEMYKSFVLEKNLSQKKSIKKSFFILIKTLPSLKRPSGGLTFWNGNGQMFLQEEQWDRDLIIIKGQEITRLWSNHDKLG